MSSLGNLKNSGRFNTKLSLLESWGNFKQNQVVLPAVYNILTLLFTIFSLMQDSLKLTESVLLHHSCFISLSLHLL